jgi:hypothetical protein
MPTEPNPTNDGVTAIAIRSVNPFLCVLQVIETSGGGAISANGVVWDIEVQWRPGVDRPDFAPVPLI